MAESVYALNNIARCTAVFKVGTVLTDPTTVVFTVSDPTGAVTTPATVHDSTGNYHADVTPTVSGTWRYEYQGTGTVVAEGQSDFFVTPDYTVARVNNAATLTWDLALALRDTTFSVWDSREMERLVIWAAAGAWPHLSREFDPSLSANIITLVKGTYFYAMPANMLAVSRIDFVDTNGNELGPLQPGAWDTEGDLLGGAAKLHIAPGIVMTGGTLRVQGYGRYDLTTNYPIDDYVPLILAMAREEALRRMVSNRAQSTQWLATAQPQNMTVNEIVLMLNEAKQDVQVLRNRYRKWFRPVPARHG